MVPHRAGAVSLPGAGRGFRRSEPGIFPLASDLPPKFACGDGSDPPRTIFFSSGVCATDPGSSEGFLPQAGRTEGGERSTVALNSRLYEAPVSLIGKKVVLLYHEHDPARVEIFLEERSYGFISLLDQKVNFRVHRGSHRTEIQSEERNWSGGKLCFPKEEPR